MAILNFDATNAPQADSLDPIPAGWYNAMMDQSDMKPTKDGSGAFLECRFSVLDGQYANRKLFTRFNLKNDNPVAQELAWKQLSSLAHATGVLQVADSAMLHGIPVRIKVKLSPAKGDYEASNDINGFKNINDGAAPAAPQQFAPMQAPAPVAPAFAAPAPMQAPQQFAPAPVQQAPAPQAPQQWAQAPQQPWAAAPAPAAPQQPAPAPAAPAQQFAPPPQPAAPAAAAPMPDWMAPPAGAAAAPAWAQQPPQA